MISLPRIKRREAKIITREQAKLLIAAARGTQLEAIVIMAITTGMRHGEIIGLRWLDINIDERCLSVRRTVTRLSGVKDRFQGRFEVTSPKTERGQRTIMLAGQRLQALQEQQVRQEEVRLKAGEKWQEHGLVFCNTHGSYLYLNPDALLAQFHRLLEKAGLPRMRFHDLRHLFPCDPFNAARHDRKVGYVPRGVGANVCFWSVTTILTTSMNW